MRPTVWQQQLQVLQDGMVALIIPTLAQAVLTNRSSWQSEEESKHIAGYEYKLVSLPLVPILLYLT